jgi:hypothetical protein
MYVIDQLTVGSTIYKFIATASLWDAIVLTANIPTNMYKETNNNKSQFAEPWFKVWKVVWFTLSLYYYIYSLDKEQQLR